MSFIKILLAAMIIAAGMLVGAGIASGQAVDDSKSYELIVVTSSPESQADQYLLRTLDTHPELKAIKGNCKFHKFATSSALYQQRYAAQLSGAQLPVIALARWDGGVLYKVSGTSIPSGDKLAEDLKHFAAMAKSVEQPIEQNPGPRNPWGQQAGDCPTCPQNEWSRPNWLPNGPADVIPETINVQPTINFPDSLLLTISIVVGCVLVAGGAIVTVVLILMLRN